MSAIVAIYNLDRRPLQHGEMQSVVDCLIHRGDDAQGVWIDGNVGLGHRMRWVTPESLHERLPMRSAASSLVITCDARIDNRDELISQLSFSNRKLSEITDSEIILQSYEKWGEECPARLIGDFVFALWNAKEQRLFCARDPLGVKHFYYFYQPGKFFALASEIKALFALENVPRELNEEHLGDYLVLNQEDKENTFYKNIKRLPSTHSLSVNQDKLQIRRYWQPDSKEIRLKSDSEYQEAFREKFTEAVTCRLRSAYPVGSMLSGGLDSSSIVCVASQYLKDNERPPLQTFSAIFPIVSEIDPRIDELRYMQSVVARTGCKAHFVNVDDSNPLRNIDDITWHADHPVGAPNVYMDWEMYKAAQKEGVRVLLSGTDGDSTVSYGYEDFEGLARRGSYLRLFKEARALNKNMPHRKHSFKRLVWHQGIKEAFPPSLINLWRALANRKQADDAVSPIRYLMHFNSVKASFRAEYDLENRIGRFMELSYPDVNSNAERHWNGLTGGQFSNLLEQLEKVSAAFNIEPRYPFFDRRLIEFCIGLPPGQRIYKGWTRSIFRFAMNGILPPDVQWRTDKSNIGASVKVNLLKHGLPVIEDAIGRNFRRLEKYVNLESLKTALRDYQAAPMRKETEALLILTNVYLSNWLEQNGFAESEPNRHAQATTANYAV